METEMKSATMSCLAAAALLAACSSDDTGNTAGTGGATAGNGAGYGQPGGAGIAAGAGHATPGSEEDLVQTAGDRIYFDTDQSIVNDQARATLDQQAAWLQQYPQVSVWIAGNCDERGTEEYNLALGARRANADRDYLVAHGIARTRIETISYGKSRPVDAASTPEAWAKNRNAITSVR
jgi:peptidoglycan-associated lipoprotein